MVPKLMVPLEIPRHIPLLSRETTFRLDFNVFTRKIVETHSYDEFPTREVYEWLLETVGHEFHSFRLYDRAFYDRHRADVLDDMAEHWETQNLPIPKQERTWSIGRFNTLNFARVDHATLFKLRWF